MNLQRLIDIKWMLQFNGYKTEDGIKYIKANKKVARSVEFKDNDMVLIKYLNTETDYKDKKEVLLEDAFNWIS
jgi:hypothetical protein